MVLSYPTLARLYYSTKYIYPEEMIFLKDMKEETSKIDALKKICEEIKALGKITDEHLAALTALFGSRFLRAWKAVKDGMVKKYVFRPSGRVVWIVVGRERDYLVMPEAMFCTCDDFYYHVMGRKAYICYHLIGQKIAEALGQYDEIEETDDIYDFLINEWKEITA
ncbi:MAG: hypothetical protein QW305_06820 [Candidatus Bathyarchaeia archaeon]